MLRKNAVTLKFHYNFSSYSILQLFCLLIGKNIVEKRQKFLKSNLKTVCFTAFLVKRFRKRAVGRVMLRKNAVTLKFHYNFSSYPILQLFCLLIGKNIAEKRQKFLRSNLKTLCFTAFLVKRFRKRSVGRVITAACRPFCRRRPFCRPFCRRL